jgi:hypothetical protein
MDRYFYQNACMCSYSRLYTSLSLSLALALSLARSLALTLCLLLWLCVGLLLLPAHFYTHLTGSSRNKSQFADVPNLPNKYYGT